ncbi:MAG: hypothetical protein ABR975_01665 [Vulcanimicrobiaceae bacterium]|jgi:hypothetical protein
MSAPHARTRIDVTSAAARRRWYLERAFRKATRGSGSDLWFLLELAPSHGVDMIESVFGDASAMLISARAVAAYAPERFTKDVDFLVPYDFFAEEEERLRAAGWERLRSLVFPNAALGLIGSAWHNAARTTEIDVITSPQAWVREAFETAVARDRSGHRVIPLAYLVLMKLDSARAIDQADLSRTLGRLDAEQVEAIVRIVERHYGDPAAGDEVRQYHEVGRWEYETPE